MVCEIFTIIVFKLIIFLNLFLSECVHSIKIVNSSIYYIEGMNNNFVISNKVIALDFTIQYYHLHKYDSASDIYSILTELKRNIFQK